MAPIRCLRRVLALALLASVAVRPGIAADRITNTAHARWTDGGVARETTSNTVEFPVETARVDMTLLREDPGSSQTQTLIGQSCPAGAGAALTSVVIGVSTSETLYQGDRLVIAVDAPAANTDVGRIETITATVSAPGSGDRETVLLHETGADTGRFAGAILTQAVPPASPAGDCTLGLADDDKVVVTVTGSDGRTSLANQTIAAPVDPRGKVFDSSDGGPVNGATITIVDADSGAPAQVFANDLVTAYPSTVISGQAVRDAKGTLYKATNGMYQFPRVRPGRYRLVIQPPAPYIAPSTATPADIATLVRPNGKPWTIGEGSYGRNFTVDGSELVRVDIPLDTPATPVALTKTASRAAAAPGDVIRYTVTLRNSDATHVRRDLVVTDALPDAVRLQARSVRLDGIDPGAALTLAPDGRTLRLAVKRVLPGATRVLTYAVQVRADARAGGAINKAAVIDPAGMTATASVAVRITDEVIASRMTVVGRITDGPCAAEGKGVGGVRVMLEDGSYAVTDRDGRYHFEGLIPGTHVVQADPTTLPAGGRFVDCARDTRAAGNDHSRFVEGGGGSIVIADFKAALPQRTAAATDDAIPAPASDKAAAGAERDWFAGGDASIAWLFPAPEHNPRAPAVRVAIRHLPGQKLQLSADGKPVEAVAFDGTRNSPDGRFAVSLWRGVPLAPGTTHLTATIRNADGSVAREMSRDVHFVTTAARAEYLPARSRLLADGVHRPLIAIRLTDSAGHPVHAGSVGDLAVSAPYEAAQAIDAEQARVLSGLERAQPTWRVAGDDGIAYVALAPTTISGALSLDFAFRDRDVTRRQRLDAWLSPGERPWTVVGLAEGRLGRKLVPLGLRGGDHLTDGRLALYAKGRIQGRWLLTLAYDSAKRRGDQRLTGEIDPNTYYTVYGDRSERRYDAASTRKLYIRLERRQFYALFGDFQTGFTDTELGRYVRVATGLKAEYRGAHVAASAFAARFPSSHRRDEIQGSGLSTGYRLLTRPILANSETIAIEVRDRLRSEKIVERRTLTRFVDYDIDYDTGAVRFSAPVLSRDSGLNPQFIVAEYEVDVLGGDRTSAGARATATLAGGTLRLGATAIRHEGQTSLGALDARFRVGADTEVRAEVAASHAGSTDAAWLVEAEHHDARFDVLAYARQLDRTYGVAEQNVAERGRRKIGVDGRVRLSDRLSLSGSAWTDSDLTGPASRRAAKVEATYRGTLSDIRLGATYAADHTAAGDFSSTLLEAGATRRFWDGRLELDAATSVALGSAKSVDFPARHRVGARLQVTPDVALTGTYELATGDAVDARTARVGFDVKPWAGARLTSAVASQDIVEQGRRAYAAYGLAQSLPLNAHWSIDASLDGERTLHGIDASRIVNPAQPVASGGYLDSGATLAENFTAMTGGATYRNGPWSATGRVEYRAGQLADRAGATFGAIRQLGDGSAMGLLATWTRATPATGKVAEALQVAGSAAIRPGSETALLAKLEWRQDRADGVESRRVIGSLSADWSPRTRDGRRLSEVSFFAGTRYAFERLDQSDIAGLTTMVGLDARFGLAERLEVGVASTVRGDVGNGDYAYAYGPSIAVRPAKDMVVTAGWNVRGFADRDFAAARTTRSGPYVNVKLKLDRDSFAFLGLRRR